MSIKPSSFPKKEKKKKETLHYSFINFKISISLERSIFGHISRGKFYLFWDLKFIFQLRPFNSVRACTYVRYNIYNIWRLKMFERTFILTAISWVRNVINSVDTISSIFSCSWRSWSVFFNLLHSSLHLIEFCWHLASFHLHEYLCSMSLTIFSFSFSF